MDEPTSDQDPDLRDIQTDLLTPAIERALSIARRDARDRGAPPPPSGLRPVMGFTKKLPPMALRTAVAALSADDAFRERVAHGADEAALGRASWLYLQRPAGWQVELAHMVEVATEEQRETDAARAEVSAVRRSEQLEDSVRRLRAELDHLSAALRAAESSLVDERSIRLAAQAERDELAGRVAALDQERARAVKQLKSTEAMADARLADLRAQRRPGRAAECPGARAGAGPGAVPGAGPG